MSKMEVHEVEFFILGEGAECDRVVMHIPSRNIIKDVLEFVSKGVFAEYGDYIYVFPSHMIERARIKSV